MKIINVYDDKSCLNPWRRGLNIRQLLNQLFFDRNRRHPDMKRQASRRQRAMDLRAARALKARYVPLCAVDSTVYIEGLDWDGHRRFRRFDLRDHVQHV